MLNCCRVAVTGSLASGKSTVCRILEELGAYVVDADAIVHQLLSPDSELGKKIISILGKDVVQQKHFDRAAIAKKVFHDDKLLKALEASLHPAVEKEIDRQYQYVCNNGLAPMFVAEIPLLFETHTQEHYDWVVVVTAKESHAQKRFQERTEYDQEEYTRRLKRMIPQEQKAERAHFILNNDGSVAELRRSVEALYPRLLESPSC